MMPSMFSGVSGLRNHQTRLNVIGNNLANINTVGYKYSRVLFSDMMYQTIQSASAPQGGRGGINPQQVGLGMEVSSIGTIHTGGNLESTGVTTDMAIQGDGFFVLSDGTNTWYTRAGNFDLNEGILVNPSNGLVVQGWEAVDGEVDTSRTLGSISIPLGGRMLSQPTTEVNYVGNLTASGSVALGTVTDSVPFLSAAKSASTLVGLKNSSGANIGVQDGDTITINGTVGATAFTGTLAVTDTTDLNTLAVQVQAVIRAAGTGTETVAVQPTGALRVTTGGSNITDLQLSINGNSVFNAAFAYADITNPGSADSNTLRSAATGTDALVSLYNASGVSLGLQAGDDITLLSAVVRGSLMSNTSVLADITAATTLEDYRAALATTIFGASPSTGETVQVDADGSIRVTGATGSANAVTALEIGAGADPGDDNRAVFRLASVCTESQAARDASNYRIATEVYDSQGTAHSVNIAFTKTDSNTWSWESTWLGTSVGSGTLVFNSNGGLISSTGDLSLPITNGAVTPLNVTPDFSSLSQLDSDYSVTLSSQDGYPVGALSKYEISNTGLVTGIYTNGLNEVLGQIALSRFSNPGGLTREGENLYSQSTNSGLPQTGAAGTAGRGTIAVGNLEMSNVDIASEFTNMIITERGFQANSKVITTSDEMLQELVNLKR